MYSLHSFSILHTILALIFIFLHMHTHCCKADYNADKTAWTRNNFPSISINMHHIETYFKSCINNNLYYIIRVCPNIWYAGKIMILYLSSMHMSRWIYNESKYISPDNFKWSPLTCATFEFHFKQLSQPKAKYINWLIDRHGLPISLEIWKVKKPTN